MQGIVVSVAVTENEQVSAGQVIAVVEAMKMQNPVLATITGRVTELRAAVGAVVAAGEVLAVIKPDEVEAIGRPDAS